MLTDLVFCLCKGSLVAAATGPAHELGAVVPAVKGRLLLALVTRLGGTIALGGGAGQTREVEGHEYGKGDKEGGEDEEENKGEGKGKT